MTLSAPESGSPSGPLANDGRQNDDRQDPAMRSLYKMSRTAGVGLQDYAAVNVLAVIGVIVAVASVLCLIFADVTAFLVLPAAAMVVCIIAFIQIQHSNGTQTGRGIAAIGFVIALALAGTNVAGRVAEAARNTRDRHAIEALVKQFESAVTTGKTTDAYAMFDARFHELVQPETFDRTITTRIEKSYGGPKVTSITLGDRIEWEIDANGVRFANALLSVKTDEKVEGLPIGSDEPTVFRLVDDQWKFHNITNWFQATAPAKGGATPAR